MNQQTIDIPFKSITRVVLVGLLLVFLYAIRDILLLLVFSVVLASAITPVVTWFEQRRVPRILGLLIVIVAIGSALGLLLYFVAPVFLGELSDLASNFPAYARLILRGLRLIGIGPGSTIEQGVQQGLQQISSLLGRGVVALPQLTVSVFGSIFAAASVLLVTFYLTLERDGVEKIIRLFVPEQKESYAVRLWRRSQKKIGFWARGQLLLMVLIGMITYVGLSILNVPYALLLALTAALLEIVPIVGPLVSGAVAVSVAVFQSPQLALFVLLFYVAVQQIEGQLVVPLLYRRILKLSPVVVIFSLMVGARFGGMIGIILAVPLVAMVMEFMADYRAGKVKL